MGIRNHRPDLNGVLVIDKPLGMSSARVVAQVRRQTGGAKVGHAGTLDPLATGVLVLCLGRATKSIDRFMSGAKRYTATIALDAFSATDDAEGERTPVDVHEPPPIDRVRAVVAERFIGEVMQTPPAFSAVKVDGQRAYRLARSGAAPVLKPRPVQIDAIDIVSYGFPQLIVDVSCGKGTYIRSLARDLGRALGTGGMLTGLVRTASDPFTLDDARALDALPERVEATDLIDLGGIG